MSFLQKRAHLCAVARGREMFARVEDMTPARFDILFLIHEHCPLKLMIYSNGYEMGEAAVTRALGLSRQTVWRMVNRLVDLGLVTKRKDPNSHPRKNILSLTQEGVRRLRQALSAAFTETVPLPRAAPTEGVVPRHWKRPELADHVVGPNGAVVLPKKVGREVEKIYTSFIWKSVHGGRRGKRFKYLALLDTMIDFMSDLAKALGNTAASIYTIRFSETFDH